LVGLDGPFVARIDFIFVHDPLDILLQFVDTRFELGHMRSVFVKLVHFIKQTIGEKMKKGDT
jgi:hypothetical protein